ncbi:folate-binding protein [Corynebacterium sp. p3-SID1145]|uniref:CAF17-like 4Fe-4S cluster assembly/insertion protein YgfZ n=1 Tax=unclassified Corynebacterium TaxID=2624378 RepID=UPI0021A9A405|nr:MULTISPECIES: folate-binding protein [unclassified Corynebacterium]MCT1452245.1 folate-binding protein [Corynebacterium sp. p3-SID1145]MCT1462113.1 folate-binding protein [Corynebacterium sp. p3-SID1140]
MNNYRSPLLSFTGAAELPDATSTLIDAAGVPSHYGDPLREQRSVERGGVAVDRSHRRVIRVAGPDAPEFLNNLLSQKLDDAPDGFSAAVCDLDMQGRILHHADITRTEDAFYLDTPSYSGESLLDYLTKMIFWSDVTVEEVDLGIITLLGTPSSFAVPSSIGAAYSREVDWAGPRRIDIAVPRERLADAFRALTAPDAGLERAGLMAFSAERVKALEPELRADLDAKSIPHEAPTLIARGGHAGAVHLNKGCYRGQETVARVENLGRSPRLLVLVHLDGSAPAEPKAGAPVTVGGRTVGRLGTVAHDCDYGPVALALVKRSALNAPEPTAAPITLEIEAGDEENGTMTVTAAVDIDSLPADEGERAGRRAVDKLRGRAR